MQRHYLVQQTTPSYIQVYRFRSARHDWVVKHLDVVDTGLDIEKGKREAKRERRRPRRRDCGPTCTERRDGKSVVPIFIRKRDVCRGLTYSTLGSRSKSGFHREDRVSLSQPLAIILKSPDMQAREAFALPMAQLKKLVIFLEQFRPDLVQMQHHLSKSCMRSSHKSAN